MWCLFSAALWSFEVPGSKRLEKIHQKPPNNIKPCLFQNMFNMFFSSAIHVLPPLKTFRGLQTHGASVPKGPKGPSLQNSRDPILFKGCFRTKGCWVSLPTTMMHSCLDVKSIVYPSFFLPFWGEIDVKSVQCPFFVDHVFTNVR